MVPLVQPSTPPPPRQLYEYPLYGLWSYSNSTSLTPLCHFIVPESIQRTF